MKKVLITGANGFIGSRLTQYLIEKELSVIAVIEPGMKIPSDFFQKDITILELKMEDISRTQIDIPDNIDLIYHFAWAGVDSRRKNLEEIQLKNIQYGLNILKMAEARNIPKVVCPGSASEYACFDGIITGKESPEPADMYGAVKAAVRYVMSMDAKSKGIQLVWTLITSIYGPGRMDNNLITYAITSFLKHEIPSFTKLEQQWDYLYIADLIYGLYLIGEFGKGGKAYPLGSGLYRPMWEYVHIIRDIIDPTLPMRIGVLPYKAKKIDHSRLDISNLCEDTGFIPKYPFEIGVRETIEYFKKNLK